MRRKLHLAGNFIRERLRDPHALRAAGLRFRAIRSGKHRLIFAVPRGQRRRGAAVLQAILHPRSEAAPGGKFICRHDVCRRINGVKG